MAISNPSSLYSAGNVVLDSSPYMRLAAQERAKQQAINEASFRHYSELPDKLNSAGVREQDWNDTTGHGGGSISANIDRQKQYFLQNSKAIIKGNTPESFNYSKMNQNNLRDIATSKSLGQEWAKTGQLHLTGRFNPREDDLPVMDNMEKSMYDKSSYKPEGGRYGFNDLSVNVPAYDVKKQQELDKAVFNGVNLQRKKNTDGTLTEPKFDVSGEKVINTMAYDPKDIYNVGQRAAQLVSADKSVYYGMKDALKDADQVKIASEMLSKVVGMPIVADTPQQMAAGLFMHKAEQTQKEQEEKDVNAANKFKALMLARRQAFTRAENIKKEEGKNKRTALMQQYNIPDLYNDALQKEPIKFKDPTTSTETDLVDVTDMTEQQKEDLYGKINSTTYKRDYEPVKIGEKEFLKKVDGKLVDKDNKPLDPDAVFAKTFGRLKASKEAVAKQKAAKGITANPPKSATKSLAERMKEAKQKK
jgi:hypothetical protein